MSTIRDYENEDWNEWEDGTLGSTIDQVKVNKTINESVLDDVLSLQSINIRMPKDLLEDLKLIATIHGTGYQPLIKLILQRFVTCEMKQMLRDKADRAAGRAIAEEEVASRTDSKSTDVRKDGARQETAKVKKTA